MPKIEPVHHEISPYSEESPTKTPTLGLGVLESKLSSFGEKVAYKFFRLCTYSCIQGCLYIKSMFSSYLVDYDVSNRLELKKCLELDPLQAAEKLLRLLERESPKNFKNFFLKNLASLNGVSRKFVIGEIDELIFRLLASPELIKCRNILQMGEYENDLVACVFSGRGLEGVEDPEDAKVVRSALKLKREYETKLPYVNADALELCRFCYNFLTGNDKRAKKKHDLTFLKLDSLSQFQDDITLSEFHGYEDVEAAATEANAAVIAAKAAVQAADKLVAQVLEESESVDKASPTSQALEKTQDEAAVTFQALEKAQDEAAVTFQAFKKAQKEAAAASQALKKAKAEGKKELSKKITFGHFLERFNEEIGWRRLSSREGRFNPSVSAVVDLLFHLRGEAFVKKNEKLSRVIGLAYEILKKESHQETLFELVCELDGAPVFGGSPKQPLLKMQ